MTVSAIMYLYDVQKCSYVVNVSLKRAKQATRTQNNDVAKRNVTSCKGTGIKRLSEKKKKQSGSEHLNTFSRNTPRIWRLNQF